LRRTPLLKPPLACCLATLLAGYPAEISSLRQQQDSTPTKTNEGPHKNMDAEHPQRRPAPSFAFGLEDGTPVQLRLTRKLSSAQDKTGDRVDFEVVEEINVKDSVIIPKGGIAWGTVAEAQRHRRLGRGGKIEIKIDEVRLADGERVRLRAVRDAHGGGRVGLMTTAIVASGILFFPVAPLFLFVQGKDITIPKDTVVTAYIDGDTALDQQHFAQDSKDSLAPAGPAVPASQPALPGDSEAPPK
jgi:hypothetical protein